MLKLTGLVAVVGLLLTATAAILATHIAMPRPASAHEDHGHFSAGEPGDPMKPARVVNIKMFEGSGKMGYAPARIEVRRGEQIRFVLQNDGEEDHEFILATVAENRKHAEVMKKNPDMEHDDLNAKRLLRTATARSFGSSPGAAHSSSPVSFPATMRRAWSAR
jgi:uncharacterized cupredoxin-like copper-binding protein